jgi:hypothetical protein
MKNTSLRVEHRLLQIFLGFLFLLSLATGFLMLFGGATSLPGVISIPTTADNELRFYSAYWLGYGALCFWIAKNIDSRFSLAVPAGIVLLLSGIGRFTSYTLVGKPAEMFVPIMIYELVQPFILFFLVDRLKKETSSAA